MTFDTAPTSRSSSLGTKLVRRAAEPLTAWFGLRDERRAPDWEPIEAGDTEPARADTHLMQMVAHGRSAGAF